MTGRTTAIRSGRLHIYRSIASSVPAPKLNANLLVASQFNERPPPPARPVYYHVTAVDTSANESTAAATSAARPADTTAPAAANRSGAHAEQLGMRSTGRTTPRSIWRATQRLRSDAADGTFTKLNVGLIARIGFPPTTRRRASQFLLQ